MCLCVCVCWCVCVGGAARIQDLWPCCGMLCSVPSIPFVSSTIRVQIRNMIMAILYIIMSAWLVCTHVCTCSVYLCFYNQLKKAFQNIKWEYDSRLSTSSAVNVALLRRENSKMQKKWDKWVLIQHPPHWRGHGSQGGFAVRQAENLNTNILK